MKPFLSLDHNIAWMFRCDVSSWNLRLRALPDNDYMAAFSRDICEGPLALDTSSKIVSLGSFPRELSGGNVRSLGICRLALFAWEFSRGNFSAETFT